MLQFLDLNFFNNSFFYLYFYEIQFILEWV